LKYTVDAISVAAREGHSAHSAPIYGGYANARGMISLFTESSAYRVNFKYRTIQPKPLLNAGAQMRYDAAQPGDVFEYCGVSFRRLSNAEIIAICSSGAFRMGLRTT